MAEFGGSLIRRRDRGRGQLREYAGETVPPEATMSPGGSRLRSSASVSSMLCRIPRSSSRGQRAAPATAGRSMVVNFASVI
jgi:hypothetical protein